jgi:hypothetical protein
MMKGSSTFHWTTKGKVVFNDVNNDIGQAQVLVCLDDKNEFIMYSYASKHTLLEILAKENSNGFESPIPFMSCQCKEHELKYYKIEEKKFSMVKAVNNFRFYILNSHVKALVLESIVNSILTHQEFCTKRGNWIANI